MGSLEIRPVHSTGDLRRFLRLPFRLYEDEPNWVAPILFERRQFLDRRKNPFFEHGRAEYFLALRDGRVVGRITAQVDDNFQRFQDNKWGWFGFFECEEDPEAAKALLDRAEQWLRGQGCDHRRLTGGSPFTGVRLRGREGGKGKDPRYGGGHPELLATEPECWFLKERAAARGRSRNGAAAAMLALGLHKGPLRADEVSCRIRTSGLSGCPDGCANAQSGPLYP